jgi:glutathione synthase/RimK-type ligase-like ATP-grasp enzyme
MVKRTQQKRIGLVVGREWSFPPAFIDEVNGRDQGVTAEFATIGGTHHDAPVPYDVLIDRISHEVPTYRSYLKHAVLQGRAVINNPFMWSADDKFFGASLVTRLGVVSPRTVLLPNKDYVPGIVPSESLRNLQYPLDWDGIIAHVGLPCVLKDAHGGGWKEVFICRTKEELIQHYNGTGLLTMIVQEYIAFDHFVRCICLGQEEILPIRYDPRARAYIVDNEYLGSALRARVVKDARTIVKALGYDMNSIEFAIKDGEPYAIDFMNPAPDFDINSLTPEYFQWVVSHMADLAIRLATDPRKQAEALGWAAMFNASRA